MFLCCGTMVSGSNLRGKEQWLQVFQPRVLGSADSGPAKLLGAQAQGKTQLLVRNKQKAGSSLDFYCRDNDHDQKQLGEDFFFFAYPSRSYSITEGSQSRKPGGKE